jgi:hypothetical protein
MPAPLASALVATIQAAAEPGWLAAARGVWEQIEPYKFYLALLIVFWLAVRKTTEPREDFNKQAQRVLDAKYEAGEISRKAYEKYRQDISLRPRR